MDNWLPERTRTWIEKRWESPVSVVPDAITYDAPWGGIRITRQPEGYAVHERGEKSGRFESFVIWVRDMEGLQKFLTWEHKSEWEAGGVHRLPNTGDLAERFEVHEDESCKLYLSWKGKPVARMPKGASGESAIVHSHLLRIQLDDLEAAIQSPHGRSINGDSVLRVAFYAAPASERAQSVPAATLRTRLWPWRRREV